jgi:hypothetical protein
MPALPPRGLVAPAGTRALMFLVRHAMPALSPEAAPERWELDSAGRLAASALARFGAGVAFWSARAAVARR